MSAGSRGLSRATSRGTSRATSRGRSGTSTPINPGARAQTANAPALDAITGPERNAEKWLQTSHLEDDIDVIEILTDKQVHKCDNGYVFMSVCECEVMSGCDLFRLVDQDGDGCVDQQELDMICADSPEIERALTLFYGGLQEGRQIDVDLWLRCSDTHAFLN